MSEMKGKMKNDKMKEIYIKPECMVYEMETEGVLCGSGNLSFEVEDDKFGGSFGNPRGW